MNLPAIKHSVASFWFLLVQYSSIERKIFNTITLLVGFLFLVGINACNTHYSELSMGSKQTSDSLFTKVKKIMETADAETINKLTDSIFYSIPNKTVFDYITFYNIKSYANETTQDYNLNLRYADSGIALIYKAKLNKILPVELAKFLARRGDAHFRLKNYAASYDDLFKAIQIAKAYSDNCGIMNVGYSISMILYKQQQYKSSAHYFIESLKYLDQCSDDDLGVLYKKQEILDNIGLCYFKIAKYDSAYYYFKAASDFVDVEKNNLAKNKQASLLRYATSKGVILGNMAKIFVQKNQLDTATILYKQAIAFHQMGGKDFNDEQICRSQLIQVYYKMNQPKLMWQNLEVLQNALPNIKDKILLMEFERLMYCYYTLEKNDSKALLHLTNYTQKRDTLEANKLRSIQPDIVKEFKDKEQEYKIDSLEKNNELNTLYLYVAALCAVFAIIVIFLVYKNYLKTKEINLQINQQKEALQKANIEKDGILHVVAHDLRNPIGAILGFMNLLIAKKELAESETRIIDAVKKAANQSLELINDLLVANHPQEQVIQLKKTEIAISNLIETAIEQVLFKANSKQQNIVFDNGLENIKLNVDADKIIRVFTNVIDNAIKFSDTKATIQILAKNLEQQVEIRIIDEGIGLPSTNTDFTNNISNLEKRIGTNGEKSVGLGLTICKQIMEAHGGSLQLNANSSKGATVIIYLPIL